MESATASRVKARAPGTGANVEPIDTMLNTDSSVLDVGSQLAVVNPSTIVTTISQTAYAFKSKGSTRTLVSIDIGLPALAVSQTYLVESGPNHCFG
jgi:hypothetical protein